MRIPPAAETRSAISKILGRYGFDHHGFATLERPFTFDVYRQWLADGCQGDMAYLNEYLDIKADPRRLGRRIEFAIVVTRAYRPHPYPAQAGAGRGQSLRRAMYAEGLDYHAYLMDEMQMVARDLSVIYANEEFLCFTDAVPILERDLAYRAGLGWVGKNTCLIHPRHGSLFWIGEILTSLPLDVGPSDAVADHCGTCDRCVAACPTGALERPRRLNATKCIAYWTIEARSAPPHALAARFGDWFFGCDICQTVCPWNQKAAGRGELARLAETRAPKASVVADLRWVLTSTNRELRRTFARTALARARPLTLKTTALNIVANESLGELLPEVRALERDPVLGPVAARVVARFTS